MLQPPFGLTELGWPLYLVDYQDSAYPRIVKSSDPEEGKTFGSAKEELLAHIRELRDHWAEQLRIAKTVKQRDI